MIKCGCGAEVESGYTEHVRVSDGEVVRITCYDCTKRERREEWQRSGHITTRLLMDAALDRGPAELVAASERLSEAARVFKEVVWWGGLSDRVRARNGHSWEGNPSLMALASAGRALVTLESPEASVTLICAEDEPGPHMAVQGISATLPQALALMMDVMVTWRNGKRPEADGKVSFGF